MVPIDLKQIPATTCQALERLLDRLERDRESLRQSGYGDSSAAMALLNALAQEADELRKSVSNQPPEIRE